MPAQKNREIRRGVSHQPPKKITPESSYNIVSVATKSEPWTPSDESSIQEVNVAMEDIRAILQKLQGKIGASDQYIFGVLDCISDDYRAQLPAGKS